MCLLSWNLGAWASGPVQWFLPHCLLGTFIFEPSFDWRIQISRLASTDRSVTYYGQKWKLTRYNASCIAAVRQRLLFSFSNVRTKFSVNTRRYWEWPFSKNISVDPRCLAFPLLTKDAILNCNKAQVRYSVGRETWNVCANMIKIHNLTDKKRTKIPDRKLICEYSGVRRGNFFTKLYVFDNVT